MTLRVVRFGLIKKVRIWLDFSNSQKKSISLLTTYCQLIKIVNGFLQRVRSHLNSGLAFCKKPMRKCTEVMIKLCKEKTIRFLLSSQMDFHMKFSSTNTKKIHSVSGIS